MPRFDSHARFDSDKTYDSGSGPEMAAYQHPPHRTMKFRLELQRKTVSEKITLGTNHINAMTGNTNYPQPSRLPTDAQVQTAQDELDTANTEADAAEITWKQKNQTRGQKEAVWDTVITARANNCEAVTPNDMAALQSTGFPLRSASAPVGQLPEPGDLKATATKNEGEIELRCKALPGASSYEWQCRLHDATAVWSQIKTGTTVKILVTGLTPGLVYAFRVRAIGSAGTGTWSDEATERAP